MQILETKTNEQSLRFLKTVQQTDRLTDLLTDQSQLTLVKSGVQNQKKIIRQYLTYYKTEGLQTYFGQTKDR